MQRNISQVQLVKVESGTNLDEQNGITNPELDEREDTKPPEKPMSSISYPEKDSKETSNGSIKTLQEENQSTKYSAIMRCCAPYLRSQNPLPENASFWERVKYGFMLPPAGLLATAVSCAMLSLLVWASVWTMTGDPGLPGGSLFGIIITTVVALLLGWVSERLNLPPLLGMLLAGIALRNIPKINFADNINHTWSSALRAIALAVILTKAGLGLDAKKLLKLSFVVIRLACLPCLVEAMVAGVASYLLLRLPWGFAFMLGFVTAAVSPAVVVPGLLNLQERRYGVDKGIPTLIIAAASIDDVLAITGFGIAQGIAFGHEPIKTNRTSPNCYVSTKAHGMAEMSMMSYFIEAETMSTHGSNPDPIWLKIIEGVIEIIVGIAAGILFGIFCWYFPSKKINFLGLFRLILVMSGGIFFTFFTKKFGFPGSGPLACLVGSFVAGMGWRRQGSKRGTNPVADVQTGTTLLWLIFQPLLFCLVGAEIQISQLRPHTVGLGIAVLSICMTFRLLVAFGVCFGTELNIKEKIFTAIAWFPKATVQAAIGAIALERARERGVDSECKAGRQILNIAVLVILITAPLGALAMALLGPRLLHRSPPEGEEEEDVVEVKSEEVKTADIEVKTDQGTGQKPKDKTTKL